MIAPQVGVIKLTKPFAATIVISVTSTDLPAPCAIGAITPPDNAAIPDDDGTNTDKIMWNK